MIASFGDRTTEDLFVGRTTSRTRRVPQAVLKVALRKMDMLDAAEVLQDLRSPPANRLEALSGGLKGLFSIRVNDQWRLVFRWMAGDAHEVRLVDYH